MYDDLITEARELCEYSEKIVNQLHTERLDYELEYMPLIETIQVTSELCDALEKAEAENRWIPVEERLPKTEKPVQVYMPKLYMSVQTGFYTKYYGEDDGEWYEHWVASGDVTHWRPLPEPPEERSRR